MISISSQSSTACRESIAENHLDDAMLQGVADLQDAPLSLCFLSHIMISFTRALHHILLGHTLDMS